MSFYSRGLTLLASIVLFAAPVVAHAALPPFLEVLAKNPCDLSLVGQAKRAQALEELNTLDVSALSFAERKSLFPIAAAFNGGEVAFFSLFGDLHPMIADAAVLDHESHPEFAEALRNSASLKRAFFIDDSDVLEGNLEIRWPQGHWGRYPGSTIIIHTESGAVRLPWAKLRGFTRIGTSPLAIQSSAPDRENPTRMSLAAARASWGLGAAVPALPAPHDIFDLVGIRPREGQTIVFQPFGIDKRFIGDNLIFGVGMVTALHRLFPRSKIKLLTSIASMLRPSDWLEPIRCDASSDSLMACIDPSDFVLTEKNQTGESILFAARRQGATAMGYELRGRSAILEITVIAPKGQFASRAGQWHSVGYQYRSVPAGVEMDHLWRSFGFDSGTRFELPSGSVYDYHDAQTRLLFGDEVGWSIPLELIADNATLEARANAFLVEAFGARAGKPLVILNLNTANPCKIGAWQCNYTERLVGLLATILKTDAEVNVLVTPPENAWGADTVISATEAIVDAGRTGRVKMIPEDKTLWPPLMVVAQSIIGEDSGFNHVSLISKSANNVFLVSNNGEAGRWRAGTQPFFGMHDRGYQELKLTDMYDVLARWLRQQARTNRR